MEARTNMAIDNADMLRQLAEATRRAEGLRQVIETISGELALEPLLTQIIESAVDLIEAQYGSIGLVVETESGPAVRIAAIYNLPASELGAIFPPGIGIAGHVLRTKQTALLERYGDLERPTLPELASHAIIGAPLWWAGKMIGFFGIGVEPPRRFGQQDIETLTLFARHAAIAIENAQRYEREQQRNEQLRLIARIGRETTADLKLDDLLGRSAAAIHELLGYPNVAIPLIDPEDPQRMILRAFGGHYRTFMEKEYSLSIADGLMGAAARDRQIVLVNDIASDPRHVPAPGAVNIRAELVVPMVIGDELLGLINSESEGRFTEEDAAILQIVADQLAVAIRNARLFEAERRRTGRLELIARVGQRIAARLDPDELFATTVDELHGRLGYDHATVFLIDPVDPNWLVKRVTASRWQGNPAGWRLPIEYGIMGTAARQRAAILVKDVRSDPRYVAIPGATDARAELAVPILLGDRLLGILDVAVSRTLRDEDVTAIQIVAGQLAGAMENARLAEQGRQFAVLEERSRLARELHDSVTQSLFSMSLLAQVLPDLWEIDRDEAREGLGQIRDLTRGALAEMRALLFELRPAALGQQDLAAALRAYLTTFERHTNIVVVYESAGRLALPEPVEQVFFRIVQEALANAARHAKARTVRVSLRGGKNTRLLIADDGQGFEITEAGAGRYGLTSMRERADSIGARMMVRSAAGEGTEIAVEWSPA
jgi:signal transduction histidine kinase